MWNLSGLRSRIFIMLAALVLITVGGALVSIWHTHTMERIYNEVVGIEVRTLRVAQELKSALIMQKGYVTYYFQDRDPQWLKELKAYEDSFEEWLKKARRWIDTEKAREILNEIDSRYIRFSDKRDRVIDLYRKGDTDGGFKLQKQIRPEFFELIDLCSQYKRLHEDYIAEAVKANRRRALTVYRLAVVALTCAIVLGLVLSYTLVKQVLGPIRQLAMGTDASSAGPRIGDEVQALSKRFEALMQDVDLTRSKLEWSREHLEQAEKWALLGKLAAGVAHSIRNPLTSVKMRLFSLDRSLDLSPDQREDFEVISEEMRHIDTIVNNFLEFSRPPKLQRRMSSPSDAVDMAVQLLNHRLESYNVTLSVQREQRLPDVFVDPDQLKEVIVNLIMNACEAMFDGGSITIRERQDVSDSIGPMVLIAVADNGPGIPEAVQSKVFQPFYSTKKEGTGLGLSIATRIVEEHGGWLDVESSPGEGSCFIITLPVREDETWGQS